MSDKTGIEWTDATWNPIAGCSIVSPGCTNCYAMKFAHRLLDKPGSHYAGTTKMVNGNAVWTGKVALAPDHILHQPLRWRCPRRIFVDSMGDLFHQDVPDDWINKVFAVMALSPHHIFQILTKRSLRMREYMTERWQPAPAQRHEIAGEVIELPAETAGDHRGHRVWEVADDIACRINLQESHPGDKFLRKGRYEATWPLPNVWLGVSVEDQQRANERIPDLQATPAAVRFLSCEPLLGRVGLMMLDRDPTDQDRAMPGFKDVTKFFHNCLDGTDGILMREGNGWVSEPKRPAIGWVIAGGESGPGARPMHPDWVRSLRDQCQVAGVPFFFKQWGEFGNYTDTDRPKSQAFDLIIDADGNVQGGGSPHYGGMCPENWRENGMAWMTKVGKKAAGRELDGKTHEEFPGRK